MMIISKKKIIIGSSILALILLVGVVYVLNLKYHIFADTITVTTADKTTYLQILSTGQSLATAYYTTPILSTTQPYNNVMLTNGVEATSAPLIPLIEAGTGEGGSCETMSSGMANTLHAYDALSRPIAIGLHGHSGAGYADLKKGTSWYNKGMLQASTTKSQVENVLGGIYRPVAVTAFHGERDYLLGAGLTYENSLEEWQSDYQNDLNTLNDSNTTTPLFINQMNAGWTGEGAVAQLNAHKDNPGKIILVEPKYQYHYRSDNLHMDINTQEKRMGEMFAKVMDKVLFEGQTWNPLMPLSVIRTDNIITIGYNIPVGTLAIDTTAVAERPNYGFEFTQTGGNSVSISSVQLVNNNSQAQITLSGSPTGTNQHIRYAWSCYSGSTWCAQAGSSTAVGGNIRDTDSSVSPEIGNTGLPLYDWGVTFNEPVTTDTTAPSIPGIPSTTSPANNNKPAWIWTASTDSGIGLANPAYSVQWCSNSGFTGCDANTATSNTNSFIHSSSLADGIWYFRVKASDLATNVSSYSSNGSVLIDTSVSPTPTPSPTITSFNLIDGQIIKTNPYLLQVKATSDVGIARVEFYVDNIKIGTNSLPDVSGEYEMSWDTSKYHSTVRIDAVDTAGNVTSVTRNTTVRLDSSLVAPTLVILLLKTGKEKSPQSGKLEDIISYLTF